MSFSAVGKWVAELEGGGGAHMYVCACLHACMWRVSSQGRGYRATEGSETERGRGTEKKKMWRRRFTGSG